MSQQHLEPRTEIGDQEQAATDLLAKGAQAVAIVIVDKNGQVAFHYHVPETSPVLAGNGLLCGVDELFQNLLGKAFLNNNPPAGSA